MALAKSGRGDSVDFNGNQNFDGAASAVGTSGGNAASQIGFVREIAGCETSTA